MNLIKSFEEFLVEAYLFEAKEEKKKSSIHPDLDMPQRHDWVSRIMDREWNKLHDNELEKAEDAGDEAKIESIKEKIRKDPKFGPEYKKFEADNARYDELVESLEKEGGADKKGLDKFAKSNPKDYSELMELQARRNVAVTSKPGGVMQLTTQDMEGGEIQAEAIRYKVKEYIKKNGKPKGIIIDNRANTGGQKNPSEAIADYLTDDDEYSIERQDFFYGVKNSKTYEDYVKDTDGWDPEVTQHFEKMSEKEKKEAWDKARKEGKVSIVNRRKNMLSKEERLTDIPVVLQTSVRTFSSGEYCSETVKNINPNVIHIGHNSGGGGNRTGSGVDLKDWNNADKSRVEQARIAAKSFADTYVDPELGKKVDKSIESWIKEEGEEKINKMTGTELAELLKKKIVKLTNDDHADIVFNDKPQGEGKYTEHGIQVLTPQVGAEKIVRDPKTKKPILDKDGNEKFEGAWEKKGTMMSGTSPFIESDPDTATRDALEYIYKKNGDKKLLAELKSDPKKFGLTKDGKDELFDSSQPSKQSSYVNSKEGYDRQKKSFEASKKNAETNAKNNLSIADQMIKASDEWKGEEKKSADDIGAKMLYAGLDEKLVEKLKKEEVIVPISPKKKKSIQRQTLMDFVMIDKNDPEEMAMTKAQMIQYAYINKIRVDNKLEPLMDFNLWVQRRYELYKDNKEFKERMQAKRKKAMNKQKPVKENLVLSFDDFVNENFKKNYGQKMSLEDFEKIEKDSEVLFRGVRYYVEENNLTTLVLKPVKGGSPVLVNLNMFNQFGAINESYKRPSATTKISGEYEITVDSKVINTQVAGFERENDSEDSLYFMDNDPLRDTVGTLIVKNSDMPKLEKGTIIKAKSSKNGKQIQIKRIGDL